MPDPRITVRLDFDAREAARQARIIAKHLTALADELGAPAAVEPGPCPTCHVPPGEPHSELLHTTPPARDPTSTTSASTERRASADTAGKRGGYGFTTSPRA